MHTFFRKFFGSAAFITIICSTLPGVLTASAAVSIKTHQPKSTLPSTSSIELVIMKSVAGHHSVHQPEKKLHPNNSSIVHSPIANPPDTNPSDTNPSDTNPPNANETVYSHSCSSDIVAHSFYALCYSEPHEQASWVAYDLSRTEATRKASDRTDDFRQDPAVSTGSASLSDYRGSGYDRGHLAPAGDMTFSGRAMSESFYLSNMSPQEPSFNRGIWRSLESLVRGWAIENGHLYVVTGGIFQTVKGKIGSNRVSVPGHYYKVILVNQPLVQKAVAFILPNQKGSGPLSRYVTTIDEVERRTGIDFFTALTDSVEEGLESAVDLSAWSFRSDAPRTYSQTRTARAINQPTNHTSSRTTASTSSRPDSFAAGERVNVNTASLAELQQLKGIGPVKAKRIVESRPFRTVDDLIRVKGIGPKTLENIRNNVLIR